MGDYLREQYGHRAPRRVFPRGGALGWIFVCMVLAWSAFAAVYGYGLG
jgi:hypothetical protein